MVLADGLLPFSEQTRELEVSAESYRDLVARLNERWPGIGPALDDYAVAIDGHIYQEAFLEPLQSDSEVYFMPKIEGG
ncbi:MAG: MoaD/ThiS family protein [Pseudomonadales bacterium]